VTRTVPPDLAGERTDKVVAVLWGVSRAEARRAVETGRVVVAGDSHPDPSARLDAGTAVAGDLEAATPGPSAGAVPFGVAYEDDAVIVVDKPPGVVVHPGAGITEGTLVSGLLDRFPGQAELGEDHRWGIVHRLDRETSGLMLVARGAGQHTRLQRDLAKRRIDRSYLALCHGRVPVATGTIDAPLGRDPKHPTRRAVRRDGKPARTHYRRLATWASVTLLDVRLETGRTHQIRVHLASIGHPLVGDQVYGRKPPLPDGADPGRVWLHARELRFDHPVDRKPVVVASPLPPDLVAGLDALGPPADGEVPPVVIR
jgi:23S rRNA pseudouridine1911/1915/1917 synthase